MNHIAEATLNFLGVAENSESFPRKTKKKFLLIFFVFFRTKLRINNNRQMRAICWANEKDLHKMQIRLA